MKIKAENEENVGWVCETDSFSSFFAVELITESLQLTRERTNEKTFSRFVIIISKFLHLT